MEVWKQRIKWGIIRTHHLPGIGSFYRKACQIGTWEAGRRLARIPGVTAVYLRHSHSYSPTFVPGQSDVDLTLVLDDGAAEDPFKVLECSAKVENSYVLTYDELKRAVNRVARFILGQRGIGEEPIVLLFEHSAPGIPTILGVLKASKLLFSYGSYGKPFLDGVPDGEMLLFNVSHSQKLVLYAIGYGREVGVDIERFKHDLEWAQIAERFFSPREVNTLHGLPAKIRLEAFFNLYGLIPHSLL